MILINMKMPERCEDCPVCHVYETATVVACGCKINMRTRELGCVTRPDWCPLIEVPPHGRLIDATALLKSISRAIEDDSDIADVYEEDYELVNDWLASAPTVIEASEVEI